MPDVEEIWLILCYFGFYDVDVDMDMDMNGCGYEYEYGYSMLSNILQYLSCDWGIGS